MLERARERFLAKVCCMLRGIALVGVNHGVLMSCPFRCVSRAWHRGQVAEVLVLAGARCGWAVSVVHHQRALGCKGEPPALLGGTWYST